MERKAKALEEIKIEIVEDYFNFNNLIFFFQYNTLLNIQLGNNIMKS